MIPMKINKMTFEQRKRGLRTQCTIKTVPQSNRCRDKGVVHGISTEERMVQRKRTGMIGTRGAIRKNIKVKKNTGGSQFCIGDKV